MLWHGTGVIPPSYGQPVFDGGVLAGLDGYGAAAPGGCEKYKRLREEALRKMWKTPVFTKKRRAYEMKANEYAARYKACALRARRVGASSAPRFKPSLPGAAPGKAARPAAIPAGRGFQPAPLPAAPAASGPPVALLAGGAAVLGLLAILAFSGKGGAAPAGKAGGKSSFTVPRSGSMRRVAR